MSVEEEFKKRLREAKEDDRLEEEVASLCYEVGRGYGNRFGQLQDVGWKDVLDWKQDIED
ncbi:hypothetical protein [Haloterrigena turkmenica]|uniref:hypothetical protein n=1 Tax=Haloterrigena turkmenica TaxID=62320 RepID=UPI0011D08938|nr:hypothetical protein [Haloterrigena turkmenica]